MPKSVIVIGAGIGGLSAAVNLARRGYEVTVLESQARVGGKLAEWRAGGFRWDIAPTPFAPKAALEALFAEAGADMADYLRWQPLDPQTRYFFADGARFSLQRDWAALAEEIERFAPGNYVGFLDFLSRAARHDSQQSASAGASIAAWLGMRGSRSMHGQISRCVKSAKLRRILGSFASELGGSPYFLPAAFSAVAHRAFSGGRWHPRGGLSQMADALERLAREQGVKILLNCPARQILAEGGLARGVALADGRTLAADAVVSAVDPITTLRFLLPPGPLPTPFMRRLNRAKLSCSAFVIMLGVRGAHPQLAHHNIFFSPDGKREHHELFKRETMPAEPTISLTVSCKTDSSDAPAGQENWLIKLDAPALSEKIDWHAQREVYRDRALEALQRRLGFDLSERIRIERILTPADLLAMTGAWRGAQFGLAAQARRLPFKTPLIRSSHLRRLYFANGSAEPGSDRALGIHSGLRAARAVAMDLGD